MGKPSIIKLRSFFLFTEISPEDASDLVKSSGADFLRAVDDDNYERFTDAARYLGKLVLLIGQHEQLSGDSPLYMADVITAANAMTWIQGERPDKSTFVSMVAVQDHLAVEFAGVNTDKAHIK